ncbi:MAG: SAM-dependent methyltransferase, partial [Planctomycetes bacterium]|nr:SAM-dependent methyltransferase [Planctomycetota bacterium]
MPALSSELRNKLATAVKDAREFGERGAESALVALEVGDKDARAGMAEDQRKLRVRLRAHGRQLGDVRQANGIQSTTRLKREIAYQHWHRMLFGRFLAENSLLMHPEHGVALSINDCRNLAEEEGRDLWEMVGSFAQGCLPQIFRRDDPALAVKLAPENLLELEALLAELPSAVFTADDSLGWVYQFWQAEEKDRVNKSEVPIGADELPAVTQLFTEHYMVQFLL